MPQTARHILGWSSWRRWHQTVATYDHDNRREALVEALASAGGGQEATGITHRVAWDQGALKVLKRWL